MEAELEKIGLMMKSIAALMRGLAIVVTPPAHHQFAAIQNPVARVSNSIFALAAFALCAIALGMVFSSRNARNSRAAHRRNRFRSIGASTASRQTRTHPRGTSPVLRLAPGRRGKP